MWLQKSDSTAETVYWLYKLYIKNPLLLVYIFFPAQFWWFKV